MQFARDRSSDPEVQKTIDDLQKALAAKDLIENVVRNPLPTVGGMAADWVVKRAFTSVEEAIGKQWAAFNARFPDAHSVLRNPRISLEVLGRQYDEARAALRLPGMRQTLVTAFFTAGLPADAPEAVVRERLRVAEAVLAQSPDVGTYIKRYQAARNVYLYAIFAAYSHLQQLREEFIASKAERLGPELHRRSGALVKSGADLRAIASAIDDSHLADVPFPLVAELVFYAASQFEKLGEGFAGLGGELDEFGDLVDDRAAAYVRVSDELAQEYKTVSERSMIE